MTYRSPTFEIGLDVDDVMWEDCHTSVCAVASKYVGYYVDPDTTPHKMEKTFGEAVAKAIWDEIDATPSWNSPIPTPELRCALQALRDLGTVVAVTSPHTTGTWMQDRQRWLYGLGFKKDDVYQTSGKFRIPVDVLVDDLAENLVPWRRRNLRSTAILFDRPNNRSTEGTDSLMFTRARGWPEVIRLVAQARSRWAADRMDA